MSASSYDMQSDTGSADKPVSALRRRYLQARFVAMLAFERIRHHALLMAFVIAGHLLALTLILVVPIYADGVNSRLLQDAMRGKAGQPDHQHLTITHFSSLYGPVTMAGFEAADAFITHDLAAVVDLPTSPVQSFIYSDKFQARPADLAGDLGSDPLTWVSLGFDESLPGRIELMEGAVPEGRGEGGRIATLVSQTLVNKFGLRVGDQLALRSDSGTADFQVVIAGIWRPRTVEGNPWPLQPFAYDEIFIVPRDVYLTDVAPRIGDAAWYSILWHTAFPPDAVTIGKAARVRAGLADLQSRAGRFLGGRIEMESPDQVLADFQARASGLRTLLYIFSAPTLLIVLLYLLSTASLLAERQRAEIAVLKGRGTSKTQIVMAHLFEGALLDILPLLAGPLVAFGAAILVGRTDTFMRFGRSNTLPLRVTVSTANLAIGTLLVTAAIGTLPILNAARQTLISYQQEVSRSTRRPLWQRVNLDLLLLIAAGYGYYTLTRQGSLVALGAANGDPFSNPLSLLLPATALVGSSLFVVRLFPRIATLISYIGQRFMDATTLLALRHLARSPEQGRSIVLLTVLTLALGSFSASMATTLDRNDIDRISYATGGTLVVTEHAEMSNRENRWTTLPAWEHNGVPGVAAWSRLLSWPAVTTIGGGTTASGTMVAIDRAGFREAGWWRDDFSSTSLPTLMNRLGAEPQAVIVNRAFLSASRLTLGDSINLTISTSAGRSSESSFIIRGVVDSFPTVYTKPGEYLFVGNFDYVTLREDPGSYSLILQPEPNASTDSIVAGLKERGFVVDEVKDLQELVRVAQARPDRVGFVGLLSLGFVAAAGLTMLALLLYSFFSFRRRMIEIGVLRAAGLSMPQLIWLLAFELCFLTVVGALVGTALGTVAARLFVPYYQLGTSIEALTPPFVVIIAWSEIGRLLAILITMLALTLIATSFLLRRLRIHEAIKLGQELA